MMEALPRSSTVIVDAIPTFLEKLHAEVDTFWQNVFANVSSKIETPLHNYLHAETEALKSRLKALF